MTHFFHHRGELVRCVCTCVSHLISQSSISQSIKWAQWNSGPGLLFFCYPRDLGLWARAPFMADVLYSQYGLVVISKFLFKVFKQQLSSSKDYSP